jgi:hypothetical protein
MKKIFIIILMALLGFLLSFSLNAQQLSQFNVSMQTGKAAYLSLDNKQSYAEGDAIDFKTKLDLVLMTDSSKQLIEWYNLRPENENIPAAVKGTHTGVVAISFDKDQFENCKSKQDHERMTGHITNHSYSHFAVVSEGKDTRYRCFLLRGEDGRKALLWVEQKAADQLSVTVKM